MKSFLSFAGRSLLAALLLELAPTLLAGTTNGTPYSWSLTDQMALPADATNIVALDASLLGPIALRADGTVLTWDGSPPPPPGLSNVVAIAAGDVFHLALRADGRPVAWGGFHVQGVAITTPPTWLTNVVAISAGYDHSVALTSDGFLIPWGANALGVLNGPTRPFNPRSFSAGQQTVLVIEENGKPFGWGTDNSGILSFPGALSDAVQISASPFLHGLGLRSDGRVFAWGNNSDGQTRVPASATNIVQVCAGPLWSLALRNDGTVLVWGQPGTPWSAAPPDPVRFLSVAAGRDRNFGLTRAPVPRDVLWRTNLPAGSSLALGRTFLGSDPFEVQWFFNGHPIPGSTNPVLNLANIQTTQAGQYQLVASNQFGSTTSLPIEIAVTDAAPRILGHPGSIAVNRGADGSLSVHAVGSDPLAFQWHFNGIPIKDQTNATLRLPSVGATNDGRYHVVVSNSLGSIVSQVAHLSTGVPAFTRQPNSFHGLENRPVRIETEVIAPEPPTFTWWRGTNLVEGATTPVFAVDRVGNSFSGFGGGYFLVASNSFGAVTSSIARVSVHEQRHPMIEPAAAIPANLNQPTPPGFNAVFDARMKADLENSFAIGIRPDRTLVAWGQNPVTQERMTPPPGISNVRAIAIGSTHAVALLRDGTVRAWRDEGYVDYGQHLVPPGLDRVVEIAAADQFNLALRDNGEIVSWPYNDTFPPHLHGVAAIAAHGFLAGALREDGTVWLWDQFSPASPVVSEPMDAIAITAGNDFMGVLLRDGAVLVLGRNGTRIELPRAPDDGWIDEIAAYGTALLAHTTDGQVWTVNPTQGRTWTEWAPGLIQVKQLSGGIGTAMAFTHAPFFHSVPGPTGVELGSTLSLGVTVSSATPVQLQWLRNNLVLPGRTNASLNVEPARHIDGGTYTVVACNERACVTSAPVVVTVSGPPEVVALPPQFPTAGEDLVFQPIVYGSEPLRYQWYFRGRAIPGATLPTLILANLQAEAAGLYELEVANPFGQFRSAPTPVGIIPSVPRIQEPKTNALTALEGAQLSVGPSVRGTDPIRYQWFHEDQPRPGQTNALLLLPAVAAADAGAWRLEAANAVGTTRGPTLRVSVAPSEPRILGQETWRLANAGVPFAWSPAIAGSEPLLRQWKRNGTDIPGATNATLSFPSVSTNDAALYSLYLSNHLGEAISGLMQLVVRPGNGPGAIVTWGQPRPPMDFGIVQDFAIGGNHAHALLTNGTVRSWINGDLPELTAPADLDDVVSLAVGSSYVIALRSDGTLRAWGYPDGGVLNIPAGLGRAVAIAAGAQHAVALLDNGVPVNWGTVTQGRTNIPAVATNLVAIAAKSGHNLGLRGDGTVVSWGPNSPVPVPASVSNIIAIAAYPRGGLALRSDLRLVSWGALPAPATSLSNLVSMAIGTGHGVGLRTNGTVVAWGSNTRGQASVPNGLSNVVAVFAGLDASAALTRSPVFASPLAPTVLSAQVGDEVRLEPSVQGLGSMSFQWLANDQPIEGQTNVTLVLGPVGPALEAFYSLRASNAWQTTVSPTIRLASFGPIEFRWDLTNAPTPRLWVRAPGFPFLTLQESTNLNDWTFVQMLAVRTNGVYVDVNPDPNRAALFYRLTPP
jgi:alpha-tubulin suppressor-like RCC1 family protein